MIHKLSDMIAPYGCEAQSQVDGRWYRAVPMPYSETPLKRFRDAWAVLCGRVYAVRWPEVGELERAMNANAGNRHPLRRPRYDIPDLTGVNWNGY